ncbi:MAG: hypothetical protein ABIO39_11630, partial [Caulobacteraceae bacterium]
MALTAVQLTSLFTTANQGAGPTTAQTTQINAIAALNLTDAQAQAQVGALLQGTVAVAALTYAYFGNTLPSAAGLDFLVSSDANATDLNDAYYVQFNQENRFLNFALNLTRGATAPYNGPFSAAFANLSYTDTISAAYEQIVGSSVAIATGHDPVAAKAFFLGSLSFYQQVVTERGGLAPTDPAFTLAVKAAIIGSIINESVKAGFGLYSDAYGRMIVQLEAGNTAGLGGPLLVNYPGSTGTFTANVVGFNTATASNSVENITTSDAANDIVNTTIARLAGAQVNGRGAPNFDILNITDTITTAVTLNNGAAGGTIGNVEQLDLKGGSTALVTGPTLAASGIGTITFEQSTFFQTGAGGGQTVNASPFNDTITVTAGSNTINAAAGADTVNITGILADAVLNGGDGADVLNFANASGLTGASSIANFETVNFAPGGVFTVSAAINEYLRTTAGLTLTGLGSTQILTVVGSGTVRGIAAVPGYALQGSMTFNIGSAGQVVTSNSGVAVIRDDGFDTLTGAYVSSGDDQFTVDRGAAVVNLTGAIFGGTFAVMNIVGTGAVTLNDSQVGSFAGFTGNPASFATLQIANTGVTTVNLGLLTNIGSVQAVPLLQAATITAAVANGTPTFVIEDSSLTVNAGPGAPANLFVIASGATATINLNNGGNDNVTINTASGSLTLNAGAGNDYVSFDSRGNFGPSDILNGGAGTDTLSFGVPFSAASGSDFNNVTNFEIIFDPNGIITSVDGLIAAGHLKTTFGMA